MPFAFLLQQSPSGALIYAPYILIGLVFYFMVFMPMQRQKKRQQEMLANLKSGDTVTTSGGIVGTVASVEGDTLVLRVKPDNLKLQFSRSAVTTLVTPEGSK